ncbi:MAG: hypothetical protein F6K58_23615 [Symploca sp. SIO2E9]|nr:hypothetical protein [Symploca sp. SIO2E9]
MSISLTPAEAAQYRDQGYCGPFKLCSPEEMSEIKAAIRAKVLSKSGPMGIPRLDRHADSRLVYDLCSHPNIVERIASILGPDLVLWFSEFFDKPSAEATAQTEFFGKQPGETTQIPLHKGTYFFPIEPQINLNAWIAFDKVTVENGCMQILPGSHKCIYPSLPPFKKIEGYQEDFDIVTDPKYVDSNDLINIELEAGEFFLFGENVIHGSLPNQSSYNRLGLVARMTIPIVKVYHEFRYEGHGVLIVKGQDYMNINHIINPPTM